MPRNHMELDQIDTLSVLSEDGSIDKSQLPKLSKEELLKSYRFLVLTRRTDEQALRYQRQGRIGTFAPSTGQEASQIGSAMAISKEDWFIPSFREVGVF